jgi:serine/threonine protein kinase/WD40 repeat protein
LSDGQLSGLLDDVQIWPQQSALIAHLDACDSCRMRLESSAADQQQWTAIQENLRARGSDDLPESAQLTAAIASLCEPTEEDLTAEKNRPDCQSDQMTDNGDSTDESASCPPTIGPYRIVKQVGRGGMGVVYKAFDPELERHVAVKRITDSLLEQPGALERFRREARSAAAIRDSHVVAIHAIEHTSPHPYLVMEFVDGMSVAEWLGRDRRLAWQDVARIGAEAAAGLAAAHAAGVVHRDVKPANILVDADTGRIKMGDFGLARTLDNSSLTQTGLVRGTPEYIAPEQAAGEQIDHRADLFSLGSVLYAACTGQPPFQADNSMAVLRRTREDRHRPIGEFRGDIPKPLIHVIDRLLNKEPDDRFATAQEVAQTLSRIQRGEQVHVGKSAGPVLPNSPLRGLLAVAALVLFVVGIGVGGIYAGATLVQEADGQTDTTLVAAKNRKKSRKPSSKKRSATAESISAAALPTRVQIVSPDDLMRERIRAEKDLLELSRHPLLVREFKGHTGPVNGIAITPDAKLLLSCSGWPRGDRSVRVWDVATGKELRQFDVAAMPKNHGDSGSREAPGEFFTIAVTPDGKHAVTGATGGAVCVWSIATGKLVRQFEEHVATVYGAAISAKGNVALTGGRHGIGRLWNPSTGEELMQLTGHRSWVRCVAISPDGKRALTGSYDNVLRLWDLDRAELIREFKTPQNWIWSVAFAPSGTVAACVSGRDVQLWDLDSGKLIQSLVGEDNGTSVDISADGRRVISGGYDGTVRLWDFDSGESLETYTGHRDWVWSVKFSPDGRHALSAGGGRNTATGGSEPGVDFAIRQWKLPPLGPRVAKTK